MTKTATTWEPVIGLEVHVQLSTATKMFCGCKLLFGAPANSLTCPVCLGLPGALPMANRRAMEYGVRIGLALNCQVAHRVKFDRKNYFYPDLPKGYQISQFDEPLCFDGYLQLPDTGRGRATDGSPDTGAQPLRPDQREGNTGADPVGRDQRERGMGADPVGCRITRAHLEEDAGKSIHMDGSTLVDLNRSGTPLVEIVGAPDLRSPEQAYLYLNTLKRNLSYLGVSELSMEKGSLRCDANISLRPRGEEKFGRRVEIKNMNSFRAVRAALEFEIRRQTEVLNGGGEIAQETRLWDEDRLETRAMRSKETANDYRYFPEPDLTSFEVPREMVEEVRASLPEMPEKRLLRFLDDYKLNPAEAEFLVSDRDVAEFYEALVRLYDHPRKAAAWVTGAMVEAMNERKAPIADIPVSPEKLAGLIGLLEDGKLNNITAKEVFRAMAETGEEAMAASKRLNKLIEQDDGAVVQAIAEVLGEFRTAAVADLKAGKEQALGFLVGQCMRKLKGKANPKELGSKIREAVVLLE